MIRIIKWVVRLFLGRGASGASEGFDYSRYDELEEGLDIISTLDSHEKHKLKESIRSGIWMLIEQKERRIGPKRWSRRNVSLGMAALVAVVLITLIYTMSDYKTAVDGPDTLVYYTAGENSLIVLPDSSTVLLNKGSRLGYPEDFAGADHRRVVLEGQAFFNVLKDERRPFVVHAKELEVHVLGTSFNVRALEGERLSKVSVRTGRVRVEKEQKRLETLLPQQELAYDGYGRTFDTRILRSADYLDWQREGALRFEDVSVDQACSVFEMIFGVSFVFKEEAIKKSRFTTQFAEGESLEKVLASICAFTNTRYALSPDGSVVLSMN